MDNSKMTAEDQLKAELLAQSAPSKQKSITSLREYLASQFKKNTLVKVKNIAEYKAGWVYVDPETEEVVQPDPVTRRVTHGQQQVRVLAPGQIVVIPGWEAYIAIDRLWKEYAQRKSPSDPNRYLSSESDMVKFVESTYVGDYTPGEQLEQPKAQSQPRSNSNRAKGGKKTDDKSKQGDPRKDGDDRGEGGEQTDTPPAGGGDLGFSEE